MAHPVEIDLLERAREHRWWYSDTNMATLLMHEIERQAKSIEEAMTQLAWKDDEIERLRLVVADWTSKTASPGLSILRMADENERLRQEIVKNAGAFGKLHNTIGELEGEIEKLRAVQEAQQRELVIRAHNQTRHLEEVQKLRAEIDALQRLVQREQAEVYRLSTVFIKPGEHE